MSHRVGGAQSVGAVCLHDMCMHLVAAWSDAQRSRADSTELLVGVKPAQAWPAVAT